MSVPAVPAVRETRPVAASGDAADDPAIFIDPANPSASVILATDKQSGLFLFALDGNVRQFMPLGRLNNVDVREDGAGGVAVASNLSDDTVTIFRVQDAEAHVTGSFPAGRPGPYGICMARAQPAGSFLVAVTDASGVIDVFRFSAPDGSDAERRVSVDLGEDIEGCVFDDDNSTLFVGREDSGITRFAVTRSGELRDPFTVDTIGTGSGIVADIEGLTLVRGETAAAGYLVASSQGNNTFAVYDRAGVTFIGRFSISGSTDGTVDPAEETDGIAATAVPLPGFPGGLLVAQDGDNAPGRSNQNFKYVRWETVLRAIDAP